jgi:DNA-directed RNA polymerase
VSTIRELQRERQMITEGRDRYVKRSEKITTTSIQNNPQKLISEVQSLVSKDLKKTIDDVSKGGSARHPSWYNDLKTIDVDIVSYVGLVSMFDAVGRNQTLTRAVSTIGQKIEMEVFNIELKQFNKKLANRIETKVTQDHSSERHRIKAAKSIAAKAGFEYEKWDDKRRVIVGTPILNSILRVSGIFDVWQTTIKNRTLKKIGLLPEASLRLSELDFDESWSSPLFAPMTVKPKDWTSFDTGCYIDEALSQQVKLVKGYVANAHIKAIEHGFEKGSIQPSIDALNAVQRTPMKLNEIIVEAVEWCWVNDKSMGKFPTRAYIEKPDKVDDFDSLTAEQKKGIRIKNKNIVVKNRQIDGQRSVMVQDLKVAKELMEYDQFYLPHNFCHRGRIYPIPHFSHHRDEHIKAMFEFANEKKVDDKAFYWIAIQVANTGDFDKVSKKPMLDRIKWVNDNAEMIIEVAQDYKSTFDYWSQADKPFSFLAACQAYFNYLVEGEGSTSGLPISLDGSNSGIQHYSAASKQERDGSLVNLVPNSMPQDVYQEVADAVSKVFTSSDDKMARDWLKFGVNRKLVKRNVMTFGYSSEVYGFKDQIIEDTMRPLADDVLAGKYDQHPFGDDQGFTAANYLAKANWKAVNQVITGASEGMKFFKTLARLLAHENKHMRWTTPVGFPVVQSYTKFTTKEIKVYLYDRTLFKNVRSQISLRDKPLRTVDKAKSASAVSPNVIHSMDAAHLLLTVLNGLQRNIQDYFLIHDSFATTAADTQKLYEIIRSSFIEIYDNFCLYQTVLNYNIKQFEDASKVDLPSIPKKGKLVLSDIKDSRYCFC